MDQPSRELVQGVPLFSDLDGKALDELRSLFRSRQYPAGQELTTEGESGLLFFVVESGEATVSVRGEEVARIGPGDAFGELALVDLSDRFATVRVLAPMQCWVLASWFFRPFVQEQPAVAWRLVELLVERLRAAQSA